MEQVMDLSLPSEAFSILSVARPRHSCCGLWGVKLRMISKEIGVKVMQSSLPLLGSSLLQKLRGLSGGTQRNSVQEKVVDLFLFFFKRLHTKKSPFTFSFSTMYLFPSRTLCHFKGWTLRLNFFFFFFFLFKVRPRNRENRFQHHRGRLLHLKVIHLVDPHPLRILTRDFMRATCWFPKRLLEGSFETTGQGMFPSSVEWGAGMRKLVCKLP